MKIVSWNVNGLRSVIKKGALSLDWLAGFDVVCLQETRCPPEIVEECGAGFKYRFAATHEKAGYAGVAVLSRYPCQLLSTQGLEEGRALALDFGGFVLLNLYVPNSKPGLKAQPMRTGIWEPAVRGYIKSLTKPVIVVGDFNVAPTALDIYMAKPANTHGASPIERADFATLLSECDLVDTYRALHPGKTGEWTWFSNFGGAREKGNGWRIDMALISASHMRKVVKSAILAHEGSDHRPILLEIRK